MNWLDTTVASPIEQANHLKQQNKDGALAFVEGIILSLEKTSTLPSSINESEEAKQKTLNHINYWRAVKAELSKDEVKKTEPLPTTEMPKQIYLKTKTK